MKTIRYHQHPLLLALTFAAGTAAPVLAADDQVESWIARFQTTYTVLFKHRIDAPSDQGAEQEVRGEIGVAQQQVSRVSRIERSSERSSPPLPR